MIRRGTLVASIRIRHGMSTEAAPRPYIRRGFGNAPGELCRRGGCPGRLIGLQIGETIDETNCPECGWRSE